MINDDKNQDTIVASAGQTVFSFDRRVDSPGETSVYFLATDQPESLLTLDSDYTEAGLGTDGGYTITTVVALDAGDQIIIEREPSYTQLLELWKHRAWSPGNVEWRLDQIIKLLIAQRDRAARSVRHRISDPQDGEVTLDEILTAVESMPQIEDGVTPTHIAVFNGGTEIGDGDGVADMVANTPNFKVGPSSGVVILHMRCAGTHPILVAQDNSFDVQCESFTWNGEPVSRPVALYEQGPNVLIPDAEPLTDIAPSLTGCDFPTAPNGTRTYRIEVELRVDLNINSVVLFWGENGNQTDGQFMGVPIAAPIDPALSAPFARVVAYITPPAGTLKAGLAASSTADTENWVFGKGAAKVASLAITEVSEL